MDGSILFLLASIGAANGLVVGAYLIVRKQRTISEIYFGALLLILSIRIGKSVLFYFSRDTDRLILQLGLSACLFIGPFFYLYSRSLYKRESKFRKIDGLMLLGLLGTITFLGLMFPYRGFPEVWNGYIIYFIYSTWFLGVMMGLYYSREVIKNMLLSPSKLTGNEHYLAAVALVILFITITYQLALFFGITYIWGALIFSFSFYYLLGRAILRNKSIIPKTPSETLPNSAEKLQQLDELVKTDKLFLNQKIKLEDLAKSAGMGKHELSKLLNEAYSFGFAHYIKAYRVNEAKSLILSRPELSLEGIGYEAGFSSKSAFFEAFKAMTNCTPAQFKKSFDTSPE